MDFLRITGGVPLEGTVRASGSKNAALPIMAASILADGPVTLQRVPDLVDVNTLALLLGHLGVEVKRGVDGCLHIATVDPSPTIADYELVRRMRASFCVLGPLLARRGRAVVSLPGGCNIGTRPVDMHLRALAALGAEIRIEHGYVIAQARHLRGTRIDMGGPHGTSVTGTANVLCAAVLARGQTVITSAAREPEIVDLGRFLIAMGADIEGLGTDTVEVRGVEYLHGAMHRVIPDRIEAATLMIAAAISGGTARVQDVERQHFGAVLEALAAAGVVLESSENEIRVWARARPRPISLVASPYPGIPTDLQAQFMALACIADGRSAITDRVFPERFMHVAELGRFGAGISRAGSTATIHGVRSLSGATVMASDLRASAALVLAGVAAKGETIVRRVYHLDRGYEGLEQKLAYLGARISREPDVTFSLGEPPALASRKHVVSHSPPR